MRNTALFMAVVLTLGTLTCGDQVRPTVSKTEFKTLAVYKEKMTRVELQLLTTDVLKSMLSERGLAVSGSKDELVSRMVESIHNSLALNRNLEELGSLLKAQLTLISIDRELPFDSRTLKEDLVLGIYVQMNALLGDSSKLDSTLTKDQLQSVSRRLKDNGGSILISGTKAEVIAELIRYWKEYQFAPIEELYSLYVLRTKTVAVLGTIAETLGLKKSGRKEEIVIRVYVAVNSLARDEDRLGLLTTSELNDAASELSGVSTSTSKATIIKRLIDYYNTIGVPSENCTYRPRSTSSVKAARIASWNIRNLSDSKDPKYLSKIASIIWSQEYDLVALQEILDVTVIQSLVAILRSEYCVVYAYDVSAEVGRYQDGGQTTGKAERYAFLWRTDVVKQDTEGVFYSDRGRSNEWGYFIREPYCALFTVNRFDFVLCSIHVIFGDSVQDRRQEVARLNTVYSAMLGQYSGEKDILIAGDFNLPPSDDAWNALQQDGFSPCIVSPETTTIGYVSLYDNIWYPREAVEVRPGTGRVFNFDTAMYGLPPPPAKPTSSQQEAWRDAKAEISKRANKEVSDHRPISIQVDTTFSSDRQSYRAENQGGGKSHAGTIAAMLGGVVVLCVGIVGAVFWWKRGARVSKRGGGSDDVILSEHEVTPHAGVVGGTSPAV